MLFIRINFINPLKTVNKHKGAELFKIINFPIQFLKMLVQRLKFLFLI